MNDFVIVRHGAGQAVLSLFVDDELYVRLAGDGLIIATPLGSSAYSMAAGGPLIATGTPAIVCTPVAMHGGSAPPLIVPAGTEARVEVHESFAGFEVQIDGHDSPMQDLEYRVSLEQDKVTLVGFGDDEPMLTGLRERGLISGQPSGPRSREAPQAGVARAPPSLYELESSLHQPWTISLCSSPARSPKAITSAPSGPGLEVPEGVARNPHGVELAELEHVVADLDPRAAADHDVDLLLVLVAVAERDAEARREPEVGQAGAFEAQRPAGEPRLHLAGHSELRRHVVDVRKALVCVVAHARRRGRDSNPRWRFPPILA